MDLNIDVSERLVYVLRMDAKIFLEDQVEFVRNYEIQKLSNLNPMEIEMRSWDSPWRNESLRFYSGLGWSFVGVTDDKVVGYILSQPILFFNNWTQTLWIEHLSFDNREVGRELLDITIRWAKSKHLQKVVLNSKIENIEWTLDEFKGFKQGDYFHLSTTKLNED